MPLRSNFPSNCVSLVHAFFIATAVTCVVSFCDNAASQEFDEPPGPIEAGQPVEPRIEPPIDLPQVAIPNIADGGLKFSFDRTPWRDVIKWLADEAELALHIQDLPTGSFTYDDPAEFTVPEAIDRVNLFLLSQGYTLVRSGRLMSVINLGDPRSLEQLDALAKLVDQSELDKLSDYDVVKCIFPLGELKAEDAVEELSALKLMTKPAVFAKTNRLMLTDSVAKLKSVRVILNGFEAKTLDNGTVMKNFALQHVDAEDILTVARPHLGLATGEMIGIDVSISSDLLGKNIFVTGVDDKVKLIEGLVTSLDKSDKDVNAEDAPPELKAYEIEGGNVETVYNVLLTLLAGKTVRLSMDEKASSIVALATPGVQKEIEATVEELQASVAEFEIIPLKNVDPYLAVNLLEQMLDLRAPTVISNKKDPRELETAYAPKIDADATNMRLFVHAKKQDIEIIRQMVEKIDADEGADENAELRIFPLRGEQAERALETAGKFWREANPIILFPTSTIEESKSERVVAEPEADDVGLNEPKEATQTKDAQDVQSPRVLGGDGLSRKPVIRCEITAEGVVMHSYDTIALARFHNQLRTLVGRADLNPSPPVVFYLKHSRTDDAVRMLAELLDGGEAVETKDGENSLVNGYLYSSTLSLGSSVTTKEGMTTLTSGTITVIADSRLNRLIAQGTTSDIELIESYLKIVDKDNSITDVETYGKSHLIELQNANANEVAAAIRQAFSGRINAAVAPTGQGGNPNSGGQQQQQQANSARDQQNPGNGKQKNDQQRSAPVRNLEPKMTVAVHESSNSLIVTAPDALYQQVEQLVQLIDIRDEQSVEIISTSDAAVYDAVMNVIAERARNGAAPTSSRTSAPARSSNPPRPGISSKSSGR